MRYLLALEHDQVLHVHGRAKNRVRLLMNHVLADAADVEEALRLLLVVQELQVVVESVDVIVPNVDVAAVGPLVAGLNEAYAPLDSPYGLLVSVLREIYLLLNGKHLNREVVQEVVDFLLIRLANDVTVRVVDAADDFDPFDSELVCLETAAQKSVLRVGTD